MSAADDRREAFEAAVRHAMTRWSVRLPGGGGKFVAEILQAFDAATAAPQRASPAPPRELQAVKPPAVHYAAPADSRGRAACRPVDRPSGWQVTTDPQAVTCGHCRKKPSWLGASAPGQGPEGAR